MTKIGVISDTHGIFDDKLIDFLLPCDELWHAGDIGSFLLLQQLENFKPLKAVFGNIDDYRVRQCVPEILRFKCEKKDILVTHIGGYPGRYEKKISEILKINPPDIFICGHSHILKVQYDKKYNMLHINPGAAGKTGFHKYRTAIRFQINNTELKELEILEIER